MGNWFGPDVSFLDEDEQKDVTVRAFPRNEGQLKYFDRSDPAVFVCIPLPPTDQSPVFDRSLSDFGLENVHVVRCMITAITSKQLSLSRTSMPAHRSTGQRHLRIRPVPVRFFNEPAGVY